MSGYLEIVSESSDGADPRWVDLRKSAWRLTATDGPNELPLHTIHLPMPMAKSLTEAVITRDADLLVIGGDNREKARTSRGNVARASCRRPVSHHHASTQGTSRNSPVIGEHFATTAFNHKHRLFGGSHDTYRRTS